MGDRLRWCGHSTVWWEQGGVGLLTDPVLTSRVAHLRRRAGPAPVLPRAPDIVLLSHLHADHLHVASLRRLRGATAFVVPVGATRFIRRALGPGFAARCIELPVGEQWRYGPVVVRAVPAAHHRGRHPWSAHRADAVGYLVGGARRVWFAGDTGLHPDMADFGPVDLALVPVGGWGPTLGPGHLDPARAVEAVRRVAARAAVPIHFGTFWPVGCARVRPDLFHEPGARFAAEAAAALPELAVTLLAPGEETTLPSAGAWPDEVAGPPGRSAGGDDR
ncbi:membrane protein [Pilimelia terevasa]|uniref:Membrane protein n=1 Tax=Pilimelia terevasa TaxID=53372 RepID=A0A8J3BJ29_9ACTN|nr:MBL fold metallo-hydrolase [Pilimelia terevasa]GGK18406.1 membrane protein [Pilimelia terevasa]